MGSSDSRHQFTNGHLYIQINQAQFNAGDTIEGVVHLQLNEKFPAKILQLEIYGAEKTFWITKERRGNSTHKKKHNGKLVFLSSKSNLFAFPAGEALPGQYSFPFRYKLPHTLPSSLLYYGPQSSKVSQRYKVIARMEEACDTSKSSFKPFLAKRRFNVIKTPDVPVLNKSLTMEKAINTFFFVKQGQSKVTVTFEKNVYQSNEIAKIKCQVDNTSCDKDITKIKVQLRRILVAKDKKGRSFKQNEILSISKYEGVKAGEQKDMSLQLKMIQNFTDLNQYLNKSVQAKKKPLVPEDIAITQHLPPTHPGQMLATLYQLEVKFTHKGMTLGSKIPSAKYQIHINAKDLGLQQGNIAAPVGWNPQIFQNQQITTQVGIPYQDSANQQYAMGIPFDQNQMTQGYGQPVQFSEPMPFYDGSQSARNQPTSIYPMGGQPTEMNAHDLALNEEKAIKERALKKQQELEAPHTTAQIQNQMAQLSIDHQQVPHQNMDYPNQANKLNYQNNQTLNGQQQQQQQDISQLYPSLDITSNYRNPQDKQ
eukprot:403359926